MPPSIKSTTKDTTVLLENPAQASLNFNIPVNCRHTGTIRAVAAIGIQPEKKEIIIATNIIVTMRLCDI
jgi:hypothetical protein